MDTNLVLRDGSTDLTADETLTSVLIGPMVRPQWLHVLTEDASEASDTLDVELEFCAAGASTTEVYNMNMKQIAASAAPKHSAIPFFTLLEYLQVKLNVTDNDSGGDFNAGGVKVWIDTTNRYDGPYNT
jgi:hypothetical protein